MLRRPFPVINFKHLLRPKRSCNPCAKRLSSTGSKGGGRKFLMSFVGATALGIGGSIAYDSYDPSFRKKIIQNVPYAEDILNFIVGPSESSSNESPNSTVPVQSVSQNESLMKKRLERSKAKLEQETSKSVSSTPVPSSPSTSSSLPLQPTSVPAPPLEIPSSSDQRFVTSEKPVDTKVTSESKRQSSVDKLIDDKSVAVVKPVPVKETKVESKSATSEAPKSDFSSIAEQIEPPAKETSNEFAQQFFKMEELEADFEKKIDLIRDEYERELIKQLKRQVAVYLDHLNDQLEVQKSELERMQRLSEEDRILTIKDKYYSELSGALSRLHDIEAVLKAREKLDEEELRARKLWLLCQSLKDSLKFSGLEEPSPLEDGVTTMKKTVEGLSIDSPMTSSILNSIPKGAIVEGVHNEDSLIERFKKVDKLCKRVALIGDEGGSIGQYVLSYLQSALLIDSVKIPEQELTGNLQVDPSKWDTFDILARVRHSLGQRNIEQALKYANQLSGAPRKVAKDWITDTRTHLEVRQAAELLQALAATITIRAVK